MRRQAPVAFAFALLWCGCVDKRVHAVKGGVDYAAQLLQRATGGPMAGASFGDGRPLAAAAMSYIAANTSGPEAFGGHIEEEKPTRAFTVVVKGGADGKEIVIEGYGEDLTRPIHTARVPLGAAGKPR